ncbi:polysaccharide biosynthesis protein [Anaerovibrio lipolyticus]|uniref:Polysaccharide biosynthesis protein n=1 Tax=Anaerovibrio lipolyticus TaxID=82374 RepID=A0A0B2JYL3_9FIRM|nr:UDP-2,4-diacetamido-2,4,6-trideoxy-beta-L-altropyranose hydrolase [Anaerovibrio lipolyticus]KHM52664.1 polysaccharide biosynthesis protein [Anaerovibrio lipolyticus]
MEIAVRVDSSSLIGSGHVMRCLTLAQRYRNEGHNVTFVCRDLEGNLADLVNKQGFQLHMLSAALEDDTLTGYAKWLTVTQERDAAETIALMQKMGRVGRIVVDSYAIDETWEKLVRPYTNEIFVIDDLANRKHDCDILLDQNFYLNKDDRYKGLVPVHCKLLLGPEHALLREEFYQAKEKMKPRDGKLHNILVFYGGADATNETSKAIEALSLLKSNGELQNVNITVVVGGSNLRNESISNHCLKEDFKYLCQVNNMAELMAEADLMLGAGGTTTWERCFLSLPAIVTAVAENQFHICDDCATAGIIHYLGQWNKVTIYDICEAVRKFTNSEMSISMQKKMSQLFS